MPETFVRVMKTQSMTKQELTRSDNRKMVAIVMAKDAMQIFRQSSPRMISSISHMEYILMIYVMYLPQKQIMPETFVRVMKTQSMTKQELTRSDNRKMVAIVMAKDAMQIFRQSSPRMISSISHMEYIGENGKDLPWNPDDLIKCLTVFMASMPQV